MQLTSKCSFFILLFLCLCVIAQAQKGDKSLAAGPLLSFPAATESRSSISDLKPGIGLEVLGQYNFSHKSALLLKSTLASWKYKTSLPANRYDRLNFLTLQVGYQYQVHPSGFFIQGLVGSDIDLQDGFKTVSFGIGASKRFKVNDTRFIDVGIDLVGGDAESRVNIKALLCLFRWFKEK